MEAEFDGQDYFLYLDKEKNELGKLKEGGLTALLKNSFSEKDKMVILSYGENDGADGIKVEYFPEMSWDKVQEVRVKVNGRAYKHVLERGRFGTRYNGSDKIEIINGLMGIV